VHIFDRMLEAIESLLNWSMEGPEDPDTGFDAKIDEFAVTVKEGHEQVAAFAATIHCQQGELALLEQAAAGTGPSSATGQAEIAAKRQEILENRETYDKLQQTLKGLETQLETARRKQESLRMEGFLKGRDGDG
jgi:phage shock protein A